MYTIILLSILSHFSNKSHPLNVNVKPIDTRIIGGAPVNDISKYPFMVSFGINSHWCGGSLIKQKWVLTAAHCIFGYESFLETYGKVRLGGLAKWSGTSISIEKVIQHPLYNNNTLEYDVALLKLQTTATNFDEIILIQDAALDDEPTIGKRSVITMGWGSDVIPTKKRNILREINEIELKDTKTDFLMEVEIFLDDSCGFYPTSEIFPSVMLCAGVDQGGKDSCQGDSGGPLITLNSNLNRYELIGVVSWGWGCAWTGFPGVYTRVWNMKDWIETAIVASPPSPPSPPTLPPSPFPPPAPPSSPAVYDCNGNQYNGYENYIGDGYCDNGIDYYFAFNCDQFNCDDGDCSDCSQSPNCLNTCNYANDGECDDGGPGAEYSECQLGTDCADCAERFIIFPPSSPQIQLLPELSALTQGENGDYMSNTKLKVVLNNLQTQYPNLVEITTIGKSVLGQDILVVKISENVTLHQNKPEFRYIANMHGDEVSGREMSLAFIQWLISGEDSRAVRLRQQAYLYIAPSVNPDGFSYNSRYNARGKDLNRDFPDQFKSPINSFEGRQPETIAVMNWTKNHFFSLSANFHDGATVANYPFDAISENYQEGQPSPIAQTPDHNEFVSLARSYAEACTPRLGNAPGDLTSSGITNGANWYTIFGSMQDWGYLWHGVFGITIEVSNEKRPSFSEFYSSIWPRHKEGMITYAEQIYKGLRGDVYDANMIPVTNATIKIIGRRTIATKTNNFGSFYRQLSPGEYAIQILKDDKNFIKIIRVLENSELNQKIILKDLDLSFSPSHSPPIPHQHYHSPPCAPLPSFPAPDYPPPFPPPFPPPPHQPPMPPFTPPHQPPISPFLPPHQPPTFPPPYQPPTFPQNLISNSCSFDQIAFPASVVKNLYEPCCSVSDCIVTFPLNLSVKIIS